MSLPGALQVETFEFEQLSGFVFVKEGDKNADRDLRGIVKKIRKRLPEQVVSYIIQTFMIRSFGCS